MVPRPRNGLSLCAGAGGLDMGLMLAEPDFHTRCFVEWEDYPRSAIIAAQRAGYFAPAPIWDNVKAFDGKPFRGAINTILAGYPCQPFSQAGQRKGDKDPRHLWPYISRIIREIQPEWVFLENVAGHVSLGAESVLRELWSMGFTPSVGLFAADEVGASHKRLRWFCVAHRNNSGGAAQQEGRERNQRRRAVNGIESMGNAACSDGNRNGRRPAGIRRHSDDGRKLADASNTGLQRRAGSRHEIKTPPDDQPVTGRGGVGVFPPAPNDSAGWADVIAYAPDLAPAVSIGDVKRSADRFAEMVARGNMAEAEAEHRVRSMADGLAKRTRVLKLLGNGVLPLCAANAWRTLAAAHGLRPVDLGAEE